MNCYGALHQVVSEPTRKKEILDLILTDMHTKYHPPVNLPPFEVDPNLKGKDSDHMIILFAPLPCGIPNYRPEKKILYLRHISEPQIKECGKFLGGHLWNEVFDEPSVDGKAEAFHDTLSTCLNVYCPQKMQKSIQL